MALKLQIVVNPDKEPQNREDSKVSVGHQDGTNSKRLKPNESSISPTYGAKSPKSAHNARSLRRMGSPNPGAAASNELEGINSANFSDVDSPPHLVSQGCFADPEELAHRS